MNTLEKRIINCLYPAKLSPSFFVSQSDTRRVLMVLCQLFECPGSLNKTNLKGSDVHPEDFTKALKAEQSNYYLLNKVTALFLGRA